MKHKTPHHHQHTNGAATGAAPRTLRAAWSIAGLCALAAAAAVLSLAAGRYYVPPAEVLRIMASIFAGDFSAESVAEKVVLFVRLPRLLLTMIVGASLAISGAALQAMFRNPLVGPQVLGVSSGAAFGGALMILLGLGAAFRMAGSMFFGILALGAVYAMSASKRRPPVLMLVLSGIIVGAFFSGLISLLKYLADPFTLLPDITFWLMGSFSGATYSKVALALIPAAPSAALVMLLRWRLNVLSLDDDDARALGAHPRLLRALFAALTSAMVAASVAVSGVVGWVGLVMPHIARMSAGANHAAMLPRAAVYGAVFLSLADTLARSISVNEIPISIVTSLIGAPLFFIILRSVKNKGWMHG